MSNKGIKKEKEKAKWEQLDLETTVAGGQLGCVSAGCCCHHCLLWLFTACHQSKEPQRGLCGQTLTATVTGCGVNSLSPKNVSTRSTKKNKTT